MEPSRSAVMMWLDGARRRLGTFVKNAVRPAGEIQAFCRDIVERPLDPKDTRTAIKDYWDESGAHNYERNWLERLRLILSVIAEGETRLPRVLGETVRRLEAKRQEGLQAAEYVAFNRKVSLPYVGGGYLHRGTVVRTVLERCNANTTAVIEMGSGWGEHLCNLWLGGGPTQAVYYACELTEFGRKCALTLAMLDPDFRLETQCFNYVSPRFEAVPAEQKEAVVYSVHSVEQVKELAPDLIRRICDIAPKVTGVHMEPMGWQMIPPGEWNELTAAHERRCKELKYNENLWSLLKQAEAEGRITIEKAEPNFFGMLYNPASLVVWRKR